MTVRGRALVAEFLGTALLLYVIVGSGIAVERLTPDAGVQLLAHAIAVGAGIAALITLLAPVSGAHFNPSVTIGARLTGSMPSTADSAAFIAAQLGGAVVGAIVANATFGEPPVAVASTLRDGFGLASAEFVATFVLVLLVLGLVRSGRAAAVPMAVGAWVATIIVATSSTGFANPAVTIARMLTDTFTGIAPGSAGAFLAAEVLGGLAAVPAALLLFPSSLGAPAVHHETEKEHIP